MGAPYRPRPAAERLKWSMSNRTQSVLIMLITSTAFAVVAYSCNKRWNEEGLRAAEESRRADQAPCRDAAWRTVSYEHQECPRMNQKLSIEGGWIRCRCK